MKSLFLAMFSVFFINSMLLAKESVDFGLATGNTDGLYYAVGSAFCNEIIKSKMSCKVFPTNGAQDNINKLISGEVKFVISQTDVLSRAIENGQQVRKVLMLYPETFNVIVRADSNIHTMDDLKGKKVNSIGSRTGSLVTARVALNMLAWGYKELEFFNTSDSFKESINDLCLGNIDSVITVNGHISPTLKTAFEACDLRLVDLVDDNSKVSFLKNIELNTLIKENDYYFKATVPVSKYYKTSQLDITTFATYAAFATGKNISDEEVYNFLTNIFAVMEAVHSNYPHLILKPILNPNDPEDHSSIPYHPGAIKFYKDKGWMKEITN